jgi:hypothetical protein
MTDLVHIAQFLQASYTILLALAFGEAFKQLVPDGDQPIRSDRLPLLLAFLFMIFPFNHGMSRYFYSTYLHDPTARLGPVANILMSDDAQRVNTSPAEPRGYLRYHACSISLRSSVL